MVHANGDDLFREFFSGSSLLFVVYDAEGRIVEANRAWTDVLGYPSDSLIGVDSWSLVTEDDVVTRSGVERELRETGRSEPSWKMIAADGTQRVVHWSLRFDRRSGRCFAVGREADASRRQADELHRRAYTDPLTGLANRTRLVAELERVIFQGAAVSVLFCDLDGFKGVNDSLGHRAGDQLLEELGRRLGAVTRREQDLIARVGGDEFVVMLPGARSEDAAAQAARLMGEIRRPFDIAGRSVQVGVSIGLASCKVGGGCEPEELLRQADMAVYEAKRTGRGRVVLFGDELRATIDRRIGVENGLRHALANDGIEVHLQPIVALPSAAVVGAEALMRWRDESGNLHMPGAFADVAEAAGLMPEIGRAVMEQALEVIAPLQRNDPQMRLTLNASGSELAAPGFVDWVTTAIRSAGARPSSVVIEVTETTVLANDVARVLSEIRRAGVRVALDDFGTGYSSLWHLRRLPVDVLKIDRSFASELADDPATRAITRAITGLCEELGIDVIMEGIETGEQAAAAEQVGASLAQGFLFHRPMPVASFQQLVAFEGATTRLGPACSQSEPDRPMAGRTLELGSSVSRIAKLRSSMRRERSW